LLVGHRSIADMLSPRALRRPKISQQRDVHGFFNSLLKSQIPWLRGQRLKRTPFYHETGASCQELR
jgi:hypothetical protein